MQRLAVPFRRKLGDREIDSYHHELARHLDDMQFTSACTLALEQDDKFPSIARLLALGRGGLSREQGVPYIRDIGRLSDCLADIDAGRSYGGDDQYRGRPGIKPMIERLVYEDAACVVEPRPGELLIARLIQISEKAEAELSRMETAATAATMPTAQPRLPQAEP
jgi:hypothetical protein